VINAKAQAVDMPAPTLDRRLQGVRAAGAFTTVAREHLRRKPGRRQLSDRPVRMCRTECDMNGQMEGEVSDCARDDQRA
jgi:hypothetical protein